jgi:hypothetical protein
MNIIPEKDIVATLSALTDSNMPFRLLRNINNELPGHLKSGKDIDILVRWNDIARLEHFLKKIRFNRVPSPHRLDQFLYGVHPLRFYKHNLLNFYIDCHFELACRSLNQGEWIPLDRKIQTRAWEKPSLCNIGGVFVPMLPSICEYLHLLTRCIFDKRNFDAGYIRRIEELTNYLCVDELLEAMQPVFFKFTSHLLELLRDKRYGEIVLSHIRFTEY